MKSTATMGWDPASDKPFLFEIDEDLADRWAHEARTLVTRARAGVVRDIVVPGSDRGDARLEVVLAPLELARRERCALWSDDPALRQVAHSEGIQVFGSLALLDALSATGHLSQEDVQSAHLEMSRSFLVDLPFDPALILQLAEEEGWIGAAAAYPLSRPVNWAEPEQILTIYRACVAQSRQTAPEGVSNWAYAACIGAARSVLPHLRQNALGALVLSGFLHSGSKPETLRELLVGARAAAQQSGLEDPLPYVARLLRRALSSAVGEEATPQLFAHMVGGLDEGDRLSAIGELLRPNLH